MVQDWALDKGQTPPAVDIDGHDGTYVGRIWRPDVDGPSICVVRGGDLVDITCREAPTMRDLLEVGEPAAFVQGIDGVVIGSLEDITINSISFADSHDSPRFLAPCDLQAIKACGVTFARSMVERIIEEKVQGDPAQAASVREKLMAIIGENLNDIPAGSDAAMGVRDELIRIGHWSQYLEVALGPDAEIFTKSQPMSAVGWGASIGVHPASKWNNSEPEIVLAIDSQRRIKGATLGNDFNLRDVEGRSALLLGKAKDNNASCAIGPFIRLFDSNFDIDDVRSAVVELVVEGDDGHRLEAASSMHQISRDLLVLVSQTVGPHHQYPDGLLLFLGTMFAPIQDRDEPGNGFTHHIGDRVSISCEHLGTLWNTVQYTDQCPPWSFGIARLMRNLAERRLI